MTAAAAKDGRTSLRKRKRLKPGPKPWDWKAALPEIEKMAQCFCTKEEIHEALGISHQTFYLYLRTIPEISETLKRGEAKGRAFLKNKSLKIASDGSVPMTIFLLKAKCGYTEGPMQLEHSGPNGGPIQNEFRALPPEQRSAKIAEIEAKRRLLLGDGTEEKT